MSLQPLINIGYHKVKERNRHQRAVHIVYVCSDAVDHAHIFFVRAYTDLGIRRVRTELSERLQALYDLVNDIINSFTLT